MVVEGLKLHSVAQLLKGITEFRVINKRSIRQRLQKCDEVLLFSFSEIERLDVDIFVLHAMTARCIVFQHLFQRLEPSVVHVGGGQFDIPQGGRAELPVVVDIAVHSPESLVLKSAEVRHIVKSVIAEGVIGKKRAGVAVGAAGVAQFDGSLEEE